MHEGQLSRMIELESRDAFAVGQNCGLSQLSQLPAIDEGLQDVLLHVVITVDDGVQFLS
jgi:hypothetical protein